MKRNTFSIALFAVVTVMVISCGRGDKSGLAIPKDASVVVHINSGGLTKKLSWAEIKQTNWFRDIYADANDSLAKKLMDDPAASGIDIEKDMAFFVKKQGRGAYMAFEGFVKDAAAFGAFNKQINKEATAVKAGDLTTMKLKDGAMLSYNDKRFVYITNAPGMGSMMPGMSGADDNQSPGYSFPADSLQMFATVLYDLPSDQSMSKDDRYESVMKEAGDMHVWINNEQAYGAMASGMLSMLKVNSLFDKNATGMALNFDNGKIAVSTKQFFSDDVKKLLEKYPAKDISADVINRIPSQNVVAAFVMNYPPEGLKAFFKLVGFDGAVNAYLQEVGYSMDEFVKANKGEIVVSVSDLQPSKPRDTSSAAPGAPSMMPGSAPDVKILFATSINDKPAFDKLVGTLTAKFGDITKSEGFPSVSYSMNKDWFAAGNSKEQVDQFPAGGNSKQGFASRISGQPFGAFVDLQKIMTNFSGEVNDTTARKAMDASLKMWQDILVTGGKIKNGSLNYEAEINLVNKSENSLKQLNRYFDEMSRYKKSNQVTF